MATTKIFPITATEAKALAYIANPDKTNNGRLILTSGCSEDPYQASRDFEEIRKLGTGLSSVITNSIAASISFFFMKYPPFTVIVSNHHFRFL